MICLYLRKLRYLYSEYYIDNFNYQLIDDIWRGDTEYIN